jgi:hypothetical protein
MVGSVFLRASRAVWQAEPDVVVRMLAGATAGGAACLVLRPGILARPAGLAPGGAVPDHVAALTRAIGMRDLVLAALTLAAPSGRWLAATNAARVLVDASDAWWFGTLLRAPGARVTVAGAAGAWAALGAAAGLRARPPARRGRG